MENKSKGSFIGFILQRLTVCYLQEAGALPLTLCEPWPFPSFLSSIRKRGLVMQVTTTAPGRVGGGGMTRNAHTASVSCTQSTAGIHSTAQAEEGPPFPLPPTSAL